VIRLLHELGIDSGYNNDYFTNDPQYSRKGKGLEFTTGVTRKQLRRDRNRGVDNSPKLIKKPFVPRHKNNNSGEPLLSQSSTVIDLANRYGWDVEHVIITSRKFSDFRKSARLHDIHTRGYIRYKFQILKELERWIGYAMYTTINQCEQADIPYTIIEFPRFTTDFDYFYHKFYETELVDSAYLHDVWTKIVDKDKVHVKDGKVNPAKWWESKPV
jgi:hypothetical protein